MSTSRRTGHVPGWLFGIVLFVAVFGAVLGGLYLFMGQDKTATPSASAPEKSAPKESSTQKTPDLPKNTPIDAFDRLSFPLFAEWKPMAGAGDPTEALSYVDTTACDQSTTMCPSFAVHNLQSAYFSSGTDGTRPFGPMLSECGVSDPSVTDTIEIDGEQADYYELDCTDGNTAYVWVVSGKDVEFAAFAGDTAALDTKAVKQMVMAITWK